MNTRCKCGAITVEIDGLDYSMPLDLFKKHFPDASIPKTTLYNCNYCVNNWGIDLCGCGSGEKFGQCDNGYEECEQPAQIIEAGIAKCSCSGGLI